MSVELIAFELFATIAASAGARTFLPRVIVRQLNFAEIRADISNWRALRRRLLKYIFFFRTAAAVGSINFAGETAVDLTFPQWEGTFICI